MRAQQLSPYRVQGIEGYRYNTETRPFISDADEPIDVYQHAQRRSDLNGLDSRGRSADQRNTSQFKSARTRASLLSIQQSAASLSFSDSHERNTMSNTLGPESNEPGHNLRSADNETLFAEVRSRQIDPGVLREQLQVSRILAADPSVRLRLSALMILGTLSLVLIGVISFLATNDMPIPDLLSGLAGSCVGAIAGILASSGGTSKSN